MSIQNKYLEFHRLKTEIVSKLKTIADGTRMDSLCDDFIEDITVGDRLTEVAEMFEELQRIELVLIGYEES